MNILNSYKLAAASLLLFAGSTAFAQGGGTVADQPTGTAPNNAVNDQWQPSLVRDGVYDRVAHINAPIGWQPIREADILWKKRVWREIDTREKQNQAFRYPGDENTGGGYFIEILIDAIKKGKIKAYSNFDDRFTTPLTKDQLQELVAGKIDTYRSVSPIDGTEQIRIVHEDFNPDLITKFRIKEDWIFDRNMGKMVVRIIGIAPVKDILGEDGVSVRASQSMFWLYYPDIRNVLAQYEVFNPQNDLARMTWDEFFESRQFSSKIIKVSNPFNSDFNTEGLNNMEKLYESQRVSEQIFNKEHDMWVY